MTRGSSLRTCDMTEQRGEAAAQSEPEAVRRFRGEGWHNIWGVILALFLACIGICLYLLASGGPQGDAGRALFLTAAIIGMVLGVWLIGRWTLPYLLTKASSTDSRTVRLMRSPRTAWFMWGRGPR